MDHKKLIATMLAQHAGLQEQLGVIVDLLKAEKIDYEAISAGLHAFGKDLDAHLRLEDNAFYPELLKDMEENGEETEFTKEFIAAMMDIEKLVIAFLEAYNTPEKIEKNRTAFEKDFYEKLDALAMRIESEEQGIYRHWDKK
jgi:hypothetical protein